jgi:hypothetical protein
MLRFLLGSAGGEGVAIDLPQRAQGREGRFDAPVVVTVSGFVGTISAYFEIDDFVRFRAGLASLYDTLTGTAELAPRERQLVLSVTGNGRGAIDIKGCAYAHPTYGSKLDFELRIDQTFLPEPIRVLDRFIALHKEGSVPAA